MAKSSWNATGLDAAPLLTELRVFAAVTGRSLLAEVMTTARVLAVSLSHSTQPYGKGKAAREAGRKAVARDIKRVFAGPAAFYDRIKRRDEGKAARFWRAWKARDLSAMGVIAASEGLEMIPEVVPAMHQARRGRKGRVKGRPKVMVADLQSRERYIKLVQKRVGLTKAGWGKAAEQCGGSRGIPVWASGRGHARASGGAVIVPDRKRPAVTIKNTTPWADEALPAREVANAERIAEEKLAKRMQIIMDKDLKRRMRLMAA